MSSSGACIFVVNPVKTDDPKALCPVADRMPKVKVALDPAENNHRIRIRNAICRTVDLMLKNPEDALSVWGSIEAKLCTAVPAKSQSTPEKDGGPNGHD